jgi:hypothetical protein
MEFILILSATLATVFAAFFLKGFSGFGPALVLIPLFTILYDAHTAISVSAFLDMIAGFYLLFPLIKRIDWRFVIPVVLVSSIGSFFGISLINRISVNLLEKLIAAMILSFIIYLLLRKTVEQKIQSARHNFLYLKYPVSLLSGLLGGLIGISGPPLVIYLKLTADKQYFREQLIAVFALGALWRSFWYWSFEIHIGINIFNLLVMSIVLFCGLMAGSKTHFKVSETAFDRIVALVLLWPVMNILFF